MSSIENVINEFLKQAQTPPAPQMQTQPLVSNPPYMGDQLQEKQIFEKDKKAPKQNKQNDSTVYKHAKRIYFFETSTHFLKRMQERGIDDDKIKEVIRSGDSKFQNVYKGTMEFVKDNIKVVLDIIKKKLITVMHLYEKEASLYEVISDMENFVFTAYEHDVEKVQKMQTTQTLLKKNFKQFMNVPDKENAKKLITVMDHYKETVEKVPFAPRIRDYKIKFELT